MGYSTQQVYLLIRTESVQGSASPYVSLQKVQGSVVCESAMGCRALLVCMQDERSVHQSLYVSVKDVQCQSVPVRKGWAKSVRVREGRTKLSQYLSICRDSVHL